jgi:hypothetical protein
MGGLTDISTTTVFEAGSIVTGVSGKLTGDLTACTRGFIGGHRPEGSAVDVLGPDARRLDEGQGPQLV